MNDHRNIDELPPVRNFIPDSDLVLFRRESDGKTCTIPFNVMMNGGEGFNFKGDLFAWNLMQPPIEIKTTEWKVPLRFNESINGPQDSNYFYFDIKVAGVMKGPEEIIPDNATYILFTMEHVNLEISDLKGTMSGSDFDDPTEYGWTKFESNRKNFVFENMQYPVQRIVPLSEVNWKAFIPDSRNHPNMNTENHASFRCPIANKDNQKIWIYAWSY
jgi:hypothetical protein